MNIREAQGKRPHLEPGIDANIQGKVVMPDMAPQQKVDFPRHPAVPGLPSISNNSPSTSS